MNIWESFLVYFLQKQHLLIKRKINDPNYLYELEHDVILHNYTPTSSSVLLRNIIRLYCIFIVFYIIHYR